MWKLMLIHFPLFFVTYCSSHLNIGLYIGMYVLLSRIEANSKKKKELNQNKFAKNEQKNA